MLILLLGGVVLVTAVVVRHAGGRSSLRSVGLVGGVAFAIRVLAVGVIHTIAVRTHAEGVWLNDEASYYLATEAILPSPWDKALPQGLEHLAGNAYLGLTTAIALLVGMDATAFRLLNVALGACVAVLSLVIARGFFGPRAGLTAGLVVAIWPTLVLWSATFLRDTVGGFAIAIIWWTLAAGKQSSHVRTTSVTVLALILLSFLRAYLAAVVAVGVAAWLLYPVARRVSGKAMTVAAVALAGAALLLASNSAQRINELAHELLYRQTTTRMETLGLLYRDQPADAPPPQPPFVPGAAVALVDAGSGWLFTGLVDESKTPGVVSVAFTDGVIRDERTSDLDLLQSAPIQAAQLILPLGPALFGFLTGLAGSGDSGSPTWVVDALAWDMLAALAILGAGRARLAFRDYLFPACVVLGTMVVLVVVPGAPGNDDRHRATQTIPLLVVLATSVLAASGRSVGKADLPVSSATRRPANAKAETPSRMRSAR